MVEAQHCAVRICDVEDQSRAARWRCRDGRCRGGRSVQRAPRGSPPSCGVNATTSKAVRSGSAGAHGAVAQSDVEARLAVDETGTTEYAVLDDLDPQPELQQLLVPRDAPGRGRSPGASPARSFDHVATSVKEEAQPPGHELLARLPELLSALAGPLLCPAPGSARPAGRRSIHYSRRRDRLARCAGVIAASSALLPTSRCTTRATHRTGAGTPRAFRKTSVRTIPGWTKDTSTQVPASREDSSTARRSLANWLAPARWRRGCAPALAHGVEVERGRGTGQHSRR